MDVTNKNREMFKICQFQSGMNISKIMFGFKIGSDFIYLSISKHIFSVIISFI